MTFPLLGKSYFFACAAIAAQSREARCKNSRSAERGCSSVHPPPNRRRMGGGSNLAPPPTGYCRAIARSAVQKQPERRALRPQARFGAQPPQAALGAEIGCSSVHPPPNRRRMGGGSNLAPPPTGYCRAIARSAVQKQPERRALRPQARFGAQPPQAALGAEIGCSSVHPPPNRRRMGGGSNLALLLGGSSKPRTTANKLSPRRAKLALNVRIGCSCRAHNHHKFSHRILQPHTKRRVSHAD